MTPVAALIIFFLFLIIIALIITAWGIFVVGTKDLDCNDIRFSNITNENDIIMLNIENNNIARIKEISFYINDLCLTKYDQEVSSNETAQIILIVEEECSPALSLDSTLHLKYRLSEHTCEFKNEI